MFAIPLVLMTLSGAADVPPTRKAILEQALAARDGLPSSYHLVLSVTWAQPDQGEKQVSTVEVWVKGDRVRTDEKKHESTFDRAGVGVRNILCRNCERKGYGIMTSQGSVGSVAQVTFLPLGPDFDVSDGHRIDWRRLGQLNGPTPDYLRETPDATLRQFLTFAGDLQKLSGEGDTGPLYQVTARLKLENTLRADLSPRHGMNPVRLVNDFKSHNYNQTTLIRYDKPLTGGVWFPSAVSCIRMLKGKELVNEQVVVKLADFTTPISDRVFTIPGLGLDYGQPIAFPEIKQSRDHPLWIDGKIDYKYTVGKSSAEAYRRALTEAAGPPVPDVDPRSGRLYYVGAAVLAILAVLAARFARRRAASS